jgi:hypothetical protein
LSHKGESRRFSTSVPWNNVALLLLKYW